MLVKELKTKGCAWQILNTGPIVLKVNCNSKPLEEGNVMLISDYKTYRT